MSNKNTILIIDGYGFVFRAYHVQPPLTSPNGQAVGALYGFTSMLLKVLNDFKPKHAVVVFDGGGKNFRHQIYDQYKANRPPAPQDLIDQLPLVRIAATSLNFPILELAGYEADDIIATLANSLSNLEENVIVVSSDKDLMQLINGRTKMYDPMKAKYITKEDVVEKFGVEPNQLREVMALIGDKSDNIPGIPSIGPKTAATLIKQFGSVETLLKSIDQVANLRQRELIKSSRDVALMSWKLVGLDFNVDVPIGLDSMIWNPPALDKISQFLREYGFKSLHKRVEHLFNLKIDTTPEVSDVVDHSIKIHEITSDEELGEVLNDIEETGLVALHLVLYKNKSVALELAFNNKCYVINFSDHRDEQVDLFTYGKDKLELWFVPQILELLSNQAIKKIVYNLKSLYAFFDCRIEACEDLELMEYSITAGLVQNDLFKTAKQSSSVEQMLESSAKIVTSFTEESTKIMLELQSNRAISLYKDIDLALCSVIHKMEKAGIKADLAYLKLLSRDFGDEILKLEKQIFDSCGVEFNIASPKQLGEVLFDKMQLPFGKLSSKAKSYSTGAEVLEKLSEQGHFIADLLLKWRQLTKLKNTYTDSLQNHINPKTNRVHTTFLQTSTATGRLSSQDPNLQNIPIRSTEGSKLRSVFIAEEGHQLISADYSQVELRILSHIADIKALKEAFLNNEDIHSQTACRIFKIKKEELTLDHRRKAKAINFGIIYGISSFGLAKQLNISSSEAAGYIEKYFEEYIGLKEYMENTKSYAREHGYVQNLFGRKCFIPSINDKNHNLRQFGERAAINAPIQGSNADIIKIAMINIDRKFEKLQLKTKLILQIHDELLFEAPLNEVEDVKKIIKDTMENSTILTIPLLVDVKSGNSWMEIH